MFKKKEFSECHHLNLSCQDIELIASLLSYRLRTLPELTKMSRQIMFLVL